ncbi:MAG: hypothetical protein EOP61_08705 [Sphingomonadales bacterium]|nr:MAG: hypothetical protein EOP61_08705 [Sphingomonadales bacterium]
MSKYARGGRNGRSGSGGIGAWAVPVAGALVLAGAAYGGWSYFGVMKQREVDAETGCLANAPTPQAVVFLVDETDHLSHENAIRIQSRIHDAVMTMPRYSRVTIVPFGGDTAAPLLPIFNKCLPGRSSTARIDEGGLLLEEEYKVFDAALNTMVSQLEKLPDSRTSPITEQIVRAASDPQLHWQGKARTMVIMTDGLESSIYWTRNLKLADPPAELLRDVSVEYFEIGNAKGNRFQTPQMRLEWKSWLERAGANVRITAPGYSARDT